MRNVFIINPKAGKISKAKKLTEKIEEYFKTTSEEVTIRITDGFRKGMKFAREEAEKGDEVRIFACGGDGTMFDVLNGMVGFQNASLGVIPCGTGNDFLKYFGSEDDFKNIGDQIGGEVRKLDVIKAGEWYSLNQCSIGMDADVCANKDKFSKLPLVNGKTAYIMSVFYCFLHSIRNRLTVTIDDDAPIIQDFLFAVAANGRYYGGGFKSAPDAVVNDGLLDCMTIKSVSRLRIVSLLNCYTKGEHIHKDFCKIKKAKRMRIDCEKETAINMDGEIIKAKSIIFEVIPEHVNFIIPRNCIDTFLLLSPKNDEKENNKLFFVKE